MATIEREYVDEWLDLSLRIDDYFTHYNNYIFRGQADAEWKLESTLTRAIKKFYPKESDDKALKLTHLRYFKENIRGRCGLDLAGCGEEELWALGQHFGLHTPLLDWTRSPYVAVFFSLFGECKSGFRALWAIFEDDIARITDATEDENKKIKLVRPLTHHNQRLVTQNGLFLDVPVGECLETLVETAPDFGWITMYKITFSNAIRDDALSALNNMNINHASLFPDLMGSSLYTNFQFEIEPYLERARDELWKENH